MKSQLRSIYRTVTARLASKVGKTRFPGPWGWGYSAGGAGWAALFWNARAWSRAPRGRRDKIEPVNSENLLGVPATMLPADPGLAEALEQAARAGTPLREVVAEYPTAPLGWALLADEAFADGLVVESYAFARVGYHRGLDSLRKAGWRGQGPVPFAHEPNRGVLRCLYALMRGAEAIDESDEVTRLEAFLRDADPTAVDQIEQEARQRADAYPPTEAFVIRGED